MRKLLSKTSALFVLLSVGCAFAAVAVSCLDQFPMNSGYYPPRPTYFIMVAGMFFWFVSGRWYPDLSKHSLLFSLVFLLVASGWLSTYLGALAHNSGRLFIFFMHSYVKWRVIPFLGLCWIASLFFHLDLERAKRIFSTALLCLFVPNAVHMLMEFIANMGFTSVRDMLVSVNSRFRTEAIVHGWWPPAFYEGRIRGLFAEPSFMTNGLMPLFGLFGYFALKNKLALIPALLLFIFYIASKCFSGYIALLVFLGISGLYAIRHYIYRYKRTSAFLFLSLFLVALVFVHNMMKTSQYQASLPYLSNISAISKFVNDAHDGKSVSMPSVDYSSPTRYSGLTRLLSMRLDVDTARKYFWGIGFGQRGFYWAPLDTHYNSLGNEEKIWVRDAANDPARGIPPLSEYTVTMAEAGFPGFVLLLGLLGYIGIRAFRSFLRTRDAYTGFMLCAYVAMTAELITIALFGINLYLLFAGYVYAISRNDSEKGNGAASNLRI